MDKKIRVLIADDSPFIRHLLADFIEEDPELELVGRAKTGQEALDLIPKVKPDVVTLDYEMPVKDGLATLKEIMNRHPLPVIMISSHTREGTRVTLEALERGAFDLIAKPEGKSPLQLYEVRDEFQDKVKAAAREFKSPPSLQTKSEEETPLPDWPPFTTGPKLIVIATSSGGPRALQNLMPLFPPNISASILIIQHMPRGFTASLAERLNRESRIGVREARDGDFLKSGSALVAPGDFHLLVNARHQVILNKKAPLWGVRPAADYTFKSAAPIFKENIIGVVLTGMGRDGSQGLLEVKKFKGRTIVEDEKTCTVFGMPKAAIKAGAADLVLPLTEIPPIIEKMFDQDKGG